MYPLRFFPDAKLTQLITRKTHHSSKSGRFCAHQKTNRLIIRQLVSTCFIKRVDKI